MVDLVPSAEEKINNKKGSGHITDFLNSVDYQELSIVSPEFASKELISDAVPGSLGAPMTLPSSLSRWIPHPHRNPENG